MFLFGGSEGGIWPSDTSFVEELRADGYNVVTVGYFGLDGISDNLNNINLNSFEKEIEKYRRYPNVDSKEIGAVGISKGGELVLILSSLYPQIHTVVAMVPSHVAFQASNLSLGQNSSWVYDDEELPFVPYPRFSFSTIKGVLSGENYRDMHLEALENKEAVEKARIKVENINGNIYLISARNDQIWPSMQMSEEVMKRLEDKNFKHVYKHKVMETNHFVLENKKTWKYVMDFLNESMKKDTIHNNKI